MSAMVVESPTLMAQLIKQYQQYVDMLEKAQAQVNKLNAINDVMNKANSFIQNGNLMIANPLEVAENLKQTLESIKYNAEQLKQSVKDYDISQHLRKKNLQTKCPFIDFDSIDPNSTNIQPKQGGGDSGDDSSSDLEALIGEFTDITAHDISTLNNGLKGLPLAILMCDRLQKYEFALKQASIEGKMNEALLNNDFEEYKKQQQEKIKQIVAQEKQSQQDFEKKLAPLKIRMEQMKYSLGVTDPSLAKKDNIEYCKKTKSGACDPVLLSLDYVKSKERKMLEKAKANSNSDQSQSQADREFLMIDYLREIATHMSFLNETMAMTANALAEEQERQNLNTKLIDKEKYDAKTTEIKQKTLDNQNAIKMENRNPKLDSAGFPVF